MSDRSRIQFVVVTVVAFIAGAYALKALRAPREADINVHRPDATRVDAFELRQGDVGVAVRVRQGSTPAAGVTVWTTRDPDEDEDEDATDTLNQRATTDADGLVTISVRKNGLNSTTLFARDPAGRVGGGSLRPDRLLSAEDIVLVDCGPRSTRLLTTNARPVSGASVTPSSFFNPDHLSDGGAAGINIPESVRPEYATETDDAGQLTLPAVPIAYRCFAGFRTTGFGEGTLTLPSGPPTEVRLAPAGTLRVHVDGGSGADLQRMKVTASNVPPNPYDPRADGVDGTRSSRHDGGDVFVLSNVVPGRYRVAVKGGPRHAVLPVATVTVDVPSGNAADVRVPLRPAGRVVGRVTDGETGQGIGGVKMWLSARGGKDAPDYGGVVTTDADGGFTAYVPAGVLVVAALDEPPPGYDEPEGQRGGTWRAKSVAAESGQTVTLPDTRLPRRRTISGRVVADGAGVAGATVEVAWDRSDHRPLATVTTDDDGMFQVPTPPGRAAVIRVRAGDRVNGTVFFPAKALTETLTIPISTASAVRLRARVIDVTGRPIERAKVVVAGMPRSSGPTAGSSRASYFSPTEVEAVFTDAAGGFVTGPLWPGCDYTLTASVDGRVPTAAQVPAPSPGQTVELSDLQLVGTGATVRGVVVAADGSPLAGASVVNSGDGPRRVEAATDAAGRFTLTGLYEGSAVVVASKPGYRRGYAAAGAGQPNPRIVLRPLTDPPAVLPPPHGEEHRRAVADLLTRFDAAIARDQPPPPPARPVDRWAAARADLDAFLKNPPAEAASPHALTELARALATDSSRSLRVLRAAADLARKPPAEAPAPPTPEIVSRRDLATLTRVHDLEWVGRAALDLGFRTEAAGWLDEAERLARTLSDDFRGGGLAGLVGEWAILDPARADRLFAELKNGHATAEAVAAAVERLSRTDPARAVVWAAKFPTGDTLVDFHRSRAAVQIADRDLTAAARVADGISGPLTRAVTLARLATTPAADRPQAHRLIDRAQTVLESPAATKDTWEVVRQPAATVYVAWQAAAVGHPAADSLVALALAGRHPVPANAHTAVARRAAAAELAAILGSLDPTAGRVVLGPGFSKSVADDPGYRNGYGETWLTALSLCDPVAAARLFDPGQDIDAAPAARATLRRPTAIARRFDQILKLGWEESPDPEDEDE